MSILNIDLDYILIEYQSEPIAYFCFHRYFHKRFWAVIRDIHIECSKQTIQMKLILLCVWAELAVLGSTKTALKFKYEI